MDDLTQAVLAREEVARYLREDHDQQTRLQTRERIYAYLDELRTTQRYPIYRALQHPLYPILRKIDRHVENIKAMQAATADRRVMYVSNHRSHTDYLVEPLALDDNGVRPPIIAAGINLFGGPLGLLHRHVTGAIPIRRATKDPAYLVTLKAYIAELLQRHDLLFYLEGGRSYNGELKPPKTGLIKAALEANRSDLVMVPVAVSYDFVLEDHSLAKQGIKRRQRAFSRELAEMVRFSVGYRSRVFVTFGEPLATAGWNAGSRRNVMRLAHELRGRIGRLYKVLPTALVATAIRPSMRRDELAGRIDALIERLASSGANLGVASGRDALDFAIEPLVKRGIIVVEGDRLRIRERSVIRYYARSLKHLLPK